jgi:4-alpha-glucanotransferase
VEDLGFMTKRVKQFQEVSDFPSMKVCQWGFMNMKAGKSDVRHLSAPQLGLSLCVYAGTHDGDTSTGWFTALDQMKQKRVCRDFHC